MRQISTPNFTGDKLQNQFTAYVKRALINNLISYYRKTVSHLQTEISCGTEDDLSFLLPSTQATTCVVSPFSQLQLDLICHEKLANELRNLSIQDFKIIHLRIVDGYTYRCIGSMLGLKEGNVRVRYFRTLQKLRTAIKGDKQ